MTTATLHSIFEIWPTTAEFAAAIGVSYGAAKQMRRRGSIPVRYWPPLMRAASDRGKSISEADLVAAHTAEPLEAAS